MCRGLTNSSPLSSAAQVEGYLKEVTRNGVNEAETLVTPETEIENIPDFDFTTTTLPNESQSMPAGPIHDEVPTMMPDFADSQNGANAFFGGGELMDLGISESLPPFEVMEELYVYLLLVDIETVMADANCEVIIYISPLNIIISLLCTPDDT